MSQSDPPDFDWIQRALYTAVVADVLDALGRRGQVLSGEWRRASGSGLLVGRAKTTLWEERDAPDPRPYELELKAVDDCRTGDVLVAAAGGSTASGVWGELLSTAAANRGCRGALVDGAVRDVVKMNALGFTVYARGTCPRDSLHRQRVVAVDVAVEIGGVTIGPGELLLADDDGVVVVPREVEAEALGQAREKVEAENVVRDAIRAGLAATEAFRKYGVL